MSQDKVCQNHPNRKALSFCHCCNGWFCHECLQVGKEYYYCWKPDCREEYEKQDFTVDKSKSEMKTEDLDELVTVASYSSFIEAQVVHAKLESENIESAIFNEFGNRFFMGGFSLDSNFQVQLKTRKSDFERASGILKGI